MSIHDMANRWTPKINYGQKMMEKTGEFAPTPWFHRKKTIVENLGSLQKLWKKKVQITSLKFWTLTGKTLMEKTETGELSKLNLLLFSP